MALVNKQDPKKIFASQAPSQDVPAEFNNYERGWDESRKNNGKPTIKQFNKLQQLTDEKILWIHQNGAALPFDETIDYAEGAVVVKDGELQQWKGGEWIDVSSQEVKKYLLAAGVDESELDGDYDFIMQRLAQIAVDKGWDASFVVDGDKNQHQINEEQNERKSVKLWAASLVDALSKYNSVDFDEDENIDAPVALMSGQNITSNGHELNQSTPATIGIETVYGAENVIVSGVKLKQDKSAPISGGTSNNHAMFKGRGGRFNAIYQAMLDGQYGVSFGYGAIGPADRSTIGNLVAFCMGIDIQGMFIENIGAKYTRIVGNILDSLSKGSMHGIRLSGYDKVGNPSESTHAPCWGVVGSANVLRNITNGISAQNSSKYSNISAMHFTDVDACIHATLGTAPANDPSMHRFDFTAHNVRKLANLQYLNHTKLGFHVDGSGFTSVGIEELTGIDGSGFNHYEGVIKDSARGGAQFRYSHNLYNLQIDGSTASGAILSGQYGGGTIISNACTTGVSIFGNYNNLNVIATNCTVNGFSCGGTGNVVQLQTDGNVSVVGTGNIITGRIGGNLNVTGNDNKFIGEVAGTVTRTGTTGNDFTGLKGWSGNVVLSEQITDGSGRVTIVVPKHTDARIRTIYATIPLNTSEWSLEVISISGGNVMFELQDSAGNAVPSTAVTFNYTYSCS